MPEIVLVAEGPPIHVEVIAEPGAKMSTQLREGGNEWVRSRVPYSQ